MFTGAKIKASHGQGASFYIEHCQCNDYYSEHNLVIGHWRGKLAECFQLAGKEIDLDTFRDFQQNINPLTKEKLTVRNVKNSVRFYDFQCSAQKSISVMSMFDPRLVEAHSKCVALAMEELERFACVRRRKDSEAFTKNYDFTGQFVYAEYHHDCSRALDPQLHTHNVIVNVTKDESFKALETCEMYKAIRYAGKNYQNMMANECRRLGYELEMVFDEVKQTVTGFEIKGVSQFNERYSRRRKQIDEAIEKFRETYGRHPTFQEVHELTIQTRDRKLITSDPDAVTKFKLSLLSNEEQDFLCGLANKAQNRTGLLMSIPSHDKAIEQIEKVAAQLYEQNNVLTLDKILAETLNQNLGKTNLPLLKATIPSVPGLLNLGGSSVNPYFSTDTIVKQELYCLDAVDNQKDLLEPLKSSYLPFSDSTDGFDHSKQTAVINDILLSKDRFMIFRGVAGSGKTSTLQELCKCIELSDNIAGIHVIAPTNTAKDILKSENFFSAETVSRFLQNPSDRPPEGSYLIVDESSLNSLEQGAELMRLAQENDYRVLFVGDVQQHHSVQYGDFLRLIQEHSSILFTELTDIRRQAKAEYREAVQCIANKDFETAFLLFDQFGYIKESAGKYLDAAADSFLNFTESGTDLLSTAVISPTHAEGKKLTQKIRLRLMDESILDRDSQKDYKSFEKFGWSETKLCDFGSYQVGQSIFFKMNCPRIAHSGEVWQLSKIDCENRIFHFENGKIVPFSSINKYIEAGRSSVLPLAKGDLIRFNVNYRSKEFTFSNGTFAVATGEDREFVLLNHNRKPLKTIKLPENFAGMNYGWVITSDSAQGLTVKNVVVAAERMGKTHFYVALSRGKENLALHIPSKDYFYRFLYGVKTDRPLVSDLIQKDKVGLQNKNIPKSNNLCDEFYLSSSGRLETLKQRLKSFLLKIPFFEEAFFKNQYKNDKLRKIEYESSRTIEPRRVEIDRQAIHPTGHGFDM